MPAADVLLLILYNNVAGEQCKPYRANLLHFDINIESCTFPTSQHFNCHQAIQQHVISRLVQFGDANETLNMKLQR